MVFRDVLKMFTAGVRGMLVTCLASSDPLINLKGKHLLWQEGNITVLEEVVVNSQTSGDIEHSVKEQVLERISKMCFKVQEEGQFWRGKLDICGEDWLDIMIEPILPIPRLLILGGGHVGQSLAHLAHLTEWPLVVVDDRPTFANAQLYPAGTQVICDDFSRAIEKIQPTANDYIVIVTRGHQYDRICLENLAGRKVAYLGMIGSKRRVRGLFEELAKEGIDSGWLEQIYSPIGLKIGAETPGEIGVSILAQLTQVRRKGAQIK